MARPQAPAGFVTIGPGIYITIAPVHAAPLKPDDSAPKYVCLQLTLATMSDNRSSQRSSYLWLGCVDQFVVRV